MKKKKTSWDEFVWFVAIVAVGVLGIVIYFGYWDPFAAQLTENESDEIKDEPKRGCPLYYTPEHDPCESGWCPVRLHIEVMKQDSTSKEDALNTGYHFDILYEPATPGTVPYDYYRYIDDATNEFVFNKGLWKNEYRTADIELLRTSDYDKLTVIINNQSYPVELKCVQNGYQIVKINFSREQNYDCYFDGLLKETNLSYADLKNFTCDKYEPTI